MVVLKQSNSLDVEWKAIKEYDYYYKIYLNDILIGTAGISVNSDDMLYIYIDEKYRGNNLGKESFDKITQKFREFNIEKIKEAAVLHRARDLPGIVLGTVIEGDRQRDAVLVLVQERRAVQSAGIDEDCLHSSVIFFKYKNIFPNFGSNLNRLQKNHVQDYPEGNADPEHLPDGRGSTEAGGRRQARPVPDCQG